MVIFALLSIGPEVCSNVILRSRFHWLPEIENDQFRITGQVHGNSSQVAHTSCLSTCKQKRQLLINSPGVCGFKRHAPQLCPPQSYIFQPVSTSKSAISKRLPGPKSHTKVSAKLSCKPVTAWSCDSPQPQGGAVQTEFGAIGPIVIAMTLSVSILAQPPGL
jgi:hypothetical protein